MDNSSNWDVEIRPQSRVFDIKPSEVWQYRHLAWMFFKRDFSTFYKQTVLGPVWYVINPIVTSLIYLFVFGAIGKIPTGGVPNFAFYLSGIIVWTYFSTSFVANAETFSKNASLFGKVYFPRIVVPFSVAMSGGVTYTIQFAILLVTVCAFLIFGVEIHLSWLLIVVAPLVGVYVALCGVGVGLVTSALTTRFRDLAYAAGFVVQLWMYASPVIYPLSGVPEAYRWVYLFNPMAFPIELLRASLFGTPFPSLLLVTINLIVAGCIMSLGLALFTKVQAVAMDTV